MLEKAKTILLIITALAALAACGSGKPEPEGASAGVSDEASRPPQPGPREGAPAKSPAAEEQWGWPTITPKPAAATLTAAEVEELILPTGGSLPSRELGARQTKADQDSPTPGSTAKTILASGPTEQAEGPNEPLPTLITGEGRIWRRPTESPPSGAGPLKAVRLDTLASEMEPGELKCLTEQGATGYGAADAEKAKALIPCLNQETKLRLLLEPMIPPEGLSARSSDCIRMQLEGTDWQRLAEATSGGREGPALTAYLLAADCLSAAEYKKASSAPALQGLQQTEARCALARAGGADQAAAGLRTGESATAAEWSQYVKICQGKPSD